jgi:hypothetical protein
MASATSFSSVAQQLSLSLGVAFAAFILELAQYLRGEAVLTVADFSFAFLAIAAVSALSIFSFFRLAHDAGAEVSGRVIQPVEKSLG